MIPSRKILFKLQNEHVPPRVSPLLSSGQYSDISIKVENEEFRSNKVLLSTRSPVLDRLFTQLKLDELCHEVTITLPPELGIESQAFKLIVNYIQDSQASLVSSDEVMQIFMAAVKLEMKDVEIECLELMEANTFHIKSSNSKIMELRKLANTLKPYPDSLINMIDRHIADNFEKIVQLPVFARMNLAKFSELLLKCKAIVDNEETILNGVILWIKARPEDQHDICVRNLFKLINFDETSLIFLQYCTDENDLLKKSYIFKAFMIEKFFDSCADIAVKKDEAARRSDKKIIAFYEGRRIIINRTKPSQTSWNISSTIHKQVNWTRERRWPVYDDASIIPNDIQLVYHKGVLYRLAYNKVTSCLHACEDGDWILIELPELVSCGHSKVVNNRYIGLIFCARVEECFQLYRYDDVNKKFYVLTQIKIDIPADASYLLVCDETRVFVFGAETIYNTISTWYYDLRGRSWHRLPNMLRLKGPIVACVSDDKIFACNEFGAIKPHTREFELFDMSTGKWRLLPDPREQPWPAGRNFVLSKGRNFCVFPDGAQGEYAAFTPEIDMWTYLKDIQVQYIGDRKLLVMHHIY